MFTIFDVCDTMLADAGTRCPRRVVVPSEWTPSSPVVPVAFSNGNGADGVSAPLVQSKPGGSGDCQPRWGAGAEPGRDQPRECWQSSETCVSMSKQTWQNAAERKLNILKFA